MATPDDVHSFWFDEISPDGRVATAVAQRWWVKDPAFDEAIRTRFGALPDAAQRGELNEWSETPQGTLALVLVCDQFPRNIFRASPRAFAYDSYAQELTLRALNQDIDQTLRPIERVFLYMPLEHSEDRTLQARCVELFSELARNVPSDQRQTFDGFTDFANRHRAIIDRFGRFPHRNATLGRTSTPEELAFLTEPGSSF